MTSEVQCRVADCERPRRYKGSGLCNMHDHRVYRTGTTDPRPDWRRKHNGCLIEGCDKAHRGNGLCNAHLQKLRKYGDPLHVVRRRRVCVVADCDSFVRGHGYCGLHLRQAIARRDLERDPWLLEKAVTTTKPAGYVAVHQRLCTARGAARNYVCMCGEPAEQWSYDHTDPNSIIDDKIGLPYTTDLSCYQPLCIPCHVRRDGAHARSMRPARKPQALAAREWQAEKNLKDGKPLLAPRRSPFRVLLRSCNSCGDVLSTPPNAFLRSAGITLPQCPSCVPRWQAEYGKRAKARAITGGLPAQSFERRDAIDEAPFWTRKDKSA